VASTVLPATKIVFDDRQQRAIRHVHGPMLVIAGAGTGKTTVLTQRVANLIREGHARPDEILALTYTDNSAAEMMARVRNELGTAASGLQACTFHAYCAGVLKSRDCDFAVLDDKDIWVYLRRRIRDLGLKHFVRAANVGQFLDSLLEFIRRCQDELVGPEDYQRYVERLERKEIPLPRVARAKKHNELTEAEILERCQEIAHVFATVEKMLGHSFGTFGHQITRAYRLLKDDSALLEEQRARTRFLLVDEFQDANFAQMELLSMLAVPAANVFAVGDPDQAIYQFRGASSEAFALFMKKFPAAQSVALDKNRRSLLPILRCAFGIVNDNPPVFSERGASPRGTISYQRSPLASLRDEVAKDEEARKTGMATAAPLVEIVTWGDKEVEAADLARSLQKKKKELRCKWDEFAVLYRQHNHRDDLVHEFGERNIPFSIEGLDVLDTPEVRDVVACLNAAVSLNDAASLFRVAALPRFGINPVELRAGMRAVRRQELDLRAVLAKVTNGPAVLECVDKAHTAVDKEVDKEVEKDRVTAAQAVKIVIRHFGLQRSALVATFEKFVDEWQKKPVAEGGSPAEFLEYLDYFVQAGGIVPLPRVEGDAVRLLTAHAAKGLEFKHVAIVRGSSTNFPTAYREPLIAFPPELRRSQGASIDEKMLHLEEERRLFYVAMTRAKDTLAIYANQGRGKKDPKPTQFLREFMVLPNCRQYWSTRSAAAVQDSLFAEEEQKIALQKSNVATWLLLPPTNAATRLSATGISIYQECPLKFKLEREWNLPRDVSAALQYGAAMHRILLTFYNAQRFKREISDADLLELFRADLASAGIADRYQYELYLHQGREQLTQFLQVARNAPAPEVMETERSFELAVGAATLVGRIDRIDLIDPANPDAVAIIDYKTGKPQSQEDADKSLQLTLYALAARDLLGKRADRLIFHNLENNTPICSTRTDAEIDAARLQVEEVAQAIAEEQFAPNPGRHCNYCSYRNLCPATEKIVPEKLVAQQKKSSCLN
jgi:DNA helicase-2/ATP-dependent DNA helicase PcrA